MTLLQYGISEPVFYGNLVDKFKIIVGKPNLSDHFKKIIKRYKRVGYSTISYDSLYAWLQTQIRLIAIVSSFIARRLVRPQTS